MKVLTICFGILFTLLGAVYYYVTEITDIFTLMPALFGILITLFGILQGKWEHKHPLYGSLLLVFLAFLGSLRALFNLFKMLTGNEVAEPTVAIVRSIIGVSCLVFIVLGIPLIKDFWRGWKAFGQLLGDWLARVVLTIFYFSVLVPFGLGTCLFSDQLRIKTAPDKLWRPREISTDTIEQARRQA